MFKKIIDTITDSLRVKNNEIIGNIYNLEKKLNGEIPVTRLELLVLVSSWGRTSIFYTNIKDDKVLIKEKNKGKSFDLSKLDTSEITDMSSIFRTSNFNGDISNWNTSNVTSMLGMFNNARTFNQELNFDTSNVISMEGMFYKTNIFNQPIIFNISKATIMSYMFEKTKAFLDKYNSGEPLPNYTNEIKEWIINNRDRMNDIDIKNIHGKDIDDFFYKIENKK